MNLKDLVPPLELCKKIPAGEFEDSAFCWHYTDMAGFICRTSGCEQVQGKVWQIVHNHPRKLEIRRKHGEEIYPAPTLQEIMANTQTRGGDSYFCTFYDGNGDENEQSWGIGDCERDLYFKNGFEGKSPTELALKWWLEQKGIE